MFLQRLWKTIQAKAEHSTAPELVYEEAELPLRIVRDLFAGDFVGAQIDDDRTHRRIVSYLKKTSPHMIERVHRYREKTPLFEASGVEQEIRSTLARRVDLPSGGYLVFDYAEAFTVIDVNTGRFVGSRGKSARRQARGHDREEQPRGREGGRAPAPAARHRRDHRHRLHRHGESEEPLDGRGGALRSELERDRTKTYVVEISPLGLVEMTRQNVTDGPREILTTKCVRMRGRRLRGVGSDPRARDRAKAPRRLRRAPGCRHSGSPSTPAFSRCSPGPGGRRLQEVEAARATPLLPRSRGDRERPRPPRSIRGPGAGQARDAPARSALEEGASLELKLVEVGSTIRLPASERWTAPRSSSPARPSSSARRSPSPSVAFSMVWRTHRSRTPRTPRRRSRSRPRRRSRRARRAERRRPQRESARCADARSKPTASPSPRSTPSSRSSPTSRGRRLRRGGRLRRGDRRRRGAEEEAHPPRNAGRARPEEDARAAAAAAEGDGGRADAGRATGPAPEDPRSLGRTRGRGRARARAEIASRSGSRGGRDTSRPQRTGSRSASAREGARVEVASGRSPRPTGGGDRGVSRAERPAERRRGRGGRARGDRRCRCGGGRRSRSCRIRADVRVDRGLRLALTRSLALSRRDR